MTSRVILAPIAWVALLVAATIQAAWLWQPVPWWLRAMPVALAIATWIRPWSGLLLLAGFLPVSGGLAALGGRSDLNGLLLEQLALAVIVGTATSRRRNREPSPLSGPALLFGTIVAVAAVAAQPTLVLRDLVGQGPWTYLVELITRGYTERWPTWGPVFTAALVIEGLALAVISERAVAARPTAARSLVALVVVSTAAVALLNLERIVSAAVGSGDFLAAFPDLLLGVRVSRFYDLNAAGSVFVLVAVAGLGLVGESGKARWWVLAPLAFILAGLWITGSRTAIATLGVAGALALVVYGLLSRGRARWIAVVALAGLLAGAAGLYFFYPTGRNLSASGALRTRVILVGVATKMWRSAPVFGVGTGRFHAESARFGATALLTELRFSDGHENAHNYPLQILAETGVVGLAALIAVLAVPLVRRAIPVRASPISLWLGAGLGAYVLTWLTGHPQLVANSALIFWLLFGTFAGSLRAGGPPRWRAALAVCIIVVLATLPVRLQRAIAAADLEHVGFGLSLWHHEAGSVPYREAGAEFALYLPADGSVAVLPLRLGPGRSGPARVRVLARGVLIREVEIMDTWREIALSLEPAGRRFELVRFEVAGSEASTGGDGWLQVGRARAR